MMKNCLLPVLFLLGVVGLEAQPVTTFTLEQAIAYGQKHNLRVTNAQIGVADADEQVLETRAIGIPKLNANINWQYFIQLPKSLIPAQIFDPMAPDGEFTEVAFGTKNNLTAGLDLSWLAFDASFLTGLEAAKVYKDYSKRELGSVKQAIKNDIIDAYLPSLIIEENKLVLDKNIANLEKILGETKALYKEGFVEQLDVDRLELSLSNLSTQRRNLDRQLKLAHQYLKFQMGFPNSRDLAVSDDINKLLIKDIQGDLEGKVDFEKRAEYLVAKMGLQLSDLNIRVNKAGYLPSLVAFGTYNYQAQADNLFKDPIWIPTAVVGLQLNIPIFDGWERRSKIARAKLDLEKAKNQTRQLENAIMLEVNNARLSYKNAQKLVEDEQKNIVLAEKIYKITKIKYKEGVGSSMEIIQAEQSLFSAQSNLINARYELLRASMSLQKALGKA